MTKPLLSPSDAAEVLCISEKQLRILTNAGAIPYLNLGLGSTRELRRYDPADLEAFIAERSSAPAPAAVEPDADWPTSPVLHRVPVPADVDGCTFVYFIASGGRVKIGRARSIKARMNALQSGSPYPIHLVHFEAGGEKEERRYHRQFKAQHDRLEWFRLEGELMEFLRSAK